MRDDDIRALFREVGDGPPVIFDAGDVISRGSRIRARRRAAAIVASAVGSAAIVVGVVVAAYGTGPGEPVRPADPVVRAVTPSTVPPPAVTHPTTPSPDASPRATTRP
ncbi:hypothetical protein ABZ215_12155 [Amycolatopsis sp. NPDC006131]|uniref:hypothetical protein n=1 Tax=Amycolatopsis sp. NPDC006131 TaxID=3156731 RepID=UPI0033BB5A59